MNRVKIADSITQSSKISVNDIVECGEEDFLCSYVTNDNGIFYVYTASLETEKFCFIKQIQVGNLFQTQIISDEKEQQMALDLFHEKYEDDL